MLENELCNGREKPHIAVAVSLIHNPSGYHSWSGKHVNFIFYTKLSLIGNFNFQQPIQNIIRHIVCNFYTREKFRKHLFLALTIMRGISEVRGHLKTYSGTQIVLFFLVGKT